MTGEILTNVMKLSGINKLYIEKRLGHYFVLSYWAYSDKTGNHCFGFSDVDLTLAQVILKVIERFLKEAIDEQEEDYYYAALAAKQANVSRENIEKAISLLKGE